MTVTDVVCVGDEVPLERIEREITVLSGQVAAATAELLVWVAAYDRRGGWASWGCASAAQWLSWKCGESLHTAREKVRVARALESLPGIAAAFGRGELSYAKVRAITRVAVPDDEDVWVVTARESTGSQLERLVAAVRSALDDAEAGAGAAFAQRSVRRRSRDGGMAEVVVRAPVDMVDTVLAAVEVVASRHVDEAAAGGSCRREVIAGRGGIAAVRADALVEIAERVLAGDAVAAQRGDVGRLQLVVELEAMRAIADATAADPDPPERHLGGRHVPREVARRWACDVVASVLVEDVDGHPCDVGRESRVVNRRLRRALHRRDRGMCRFPGCGATAWLHAHHVVHWADGGGTDLGNLVSLCGFHHRLVHEGGWQVAIVDGAVVWCDPDGVPATIEAMTGDPDQLRQRVGPVAIPEPQLPSGRLDFAYAASVLAEHAITRRRRAGPHHDVPGGDVARK